MYNIKLKNNEKIKLISDNTIVYHNEKETTICTSIITNYRYLILDYKSDKFNFQEELRILGRINYPKQKEIIFETELENIISIKKKKDYYQINLSNNLYILIKDIDIINYLKNN